MSDDHAHDGGHHDHRPHGHGHGRGRRRGVRPGKPSFGAWISNWNEYDAATGTKLAMAARNLFLSRWRNALMCCGHPGQPGC